MSCPPTTLAAQEELKCIQEELRKEVPLDGLAPGEKVHFPSEGDFAAFRPFNTAHVDSFLYGEDEVVQHLMDGFVVGFLFQNCIQEVF